MPIIARKNRPLIPLTRSSSRERRTAHIERCPACRELWDSGRMTDEDGIRKCPNDVDVTTETYKAAILEREAARADLYNIEPNISQAVMEPVIPATVTRVAISATAPVIYNGNPLLLRRGVATSMILFGRGFTSTDTVGYSSASITNDDPPVITSTTITLLMLADPGMTPGTYSVTLNGNTLRGILQVR